MKHISRILVVLLLLAMVLPLAVSCAETVDSADTTLPAQTEAPSGDVAPGGRFKFSFIAADAPAPVIDESSAATEEVITEEGKGCGSVAPAGAILAIPAAAKLCFKKKEDEEN